MVHEEAEQLIGRARMGDQVALAEVLEQYRDRLRRMVVVRMDPRVRGRFDASDVIQEAYVDISRRIASDGANANIPFFLWLRILTGDRLAQLHRMHLGADMRNAAREVSLGSGVIPPASSVHLASQLAGQFSSVDRGLKREEVRVKLEAAINSMDETDRDVIAMRHFEELSTEEIAIVLDMTRSGVLKRYTRAIRRLSVAINTVSDISLS